MSYFQKNFLHAITVLGYLSKLKRYLAFGAHFLRDFSIKMSLMCPIYGQNFNAILIFFFKISKKMWY